MWPEESPEVLLAELAPQGEARVSVRAGPGKGWHLEAACLGLRGNACRSGVVLGHYILTLPSKFPGRCQVDPPIARRVQLAAPVWPPERAKTFNEYLWTLGKTGVRDYSRVVKVITIQLWTNAALTFHGVWIECAPKF